MPCQETTPVDITSMLPSPHHRLRRVCGATEARYQGAGGSAVSGFAPHLSPSGAWPWPVPRPQATLPPVTFAPFCALCAPFTSLEKVVDWGASQGV
ncbi:MAG: hypothetical protein ABW185_27150 [Sedimenticola sp.]